MLNLVLAPFVFLGAFSEGVHSPVLLRLCKLRFDKVDDGHDIRKGYANDYEEGVSQYVHKPAFVFVEIGQAVLRGINYVHEVDCRFAVVQDAVDVESKEHQNKQKFQAVKIIFDVKLDFFAGVQVQGEDN